MHFRDIVGQESIKERLIQTVKENRISHAQLFFGPEGVGKLPLAIAYAQYISCLDPREDDSCGVCSSCFKYNKLVHPDLHFVFPVVKSTGNQNPVSDNFLAEWRKMITENPYFNVNQWYESIGAENVQGSIYVHESAEIIRKLSLKTFESEYKIMIIWLPEKMNISAANKLLKIIEEPPPKTLFILVSENIDLILQTIQSRTQLVKIHKIDNHSLISALKKQFSFEEDKAVDIVRLSDGNFINILNNVHSNNEHSFYFQEFMNLMRKSYANNVVDIIPWVDKIATIGREKQKSFLEYSLRMVRENFLLNNNLKSMNTMLHDETEFSNKFHIFINQNNVLEISDELNKAYYHIERNGNPKIVFADISLKLSRLLRK